MSMADESKAMPSSLPRRDQWSRAIIGPDASFMEYFFLPVE
jgi:hypothetical protein